MKFLKSVLFFVLLFSLVVPKTAVHAGDYVSDAIEALKTSNVYVAPNTEGTDYNTASQLRMFLGASDNIVLVMLPIDALTGTDLYSLAQKISAGLDNQKTIGLAVGRQVIGYSVILPEGVASDKMSRASDVSNDPVTALITFTQNIHTWQANNPEYRPTPTPEPTATPRPTMAPIKLPKAEDVPWAAKGLFLVLIPIFTIFFVKTTIRAVKVNNKRLERQKRTDLLNSMKRSIEKIEANVAKIKELKVRKDLEGACLAAYGLVQIFEQSVQPMGMTEAQVPSLLSNVNRQVMALARHESRTRPLSEEFLTQLKSVLLNYDSLFVKLQDNDPESVDLLASIMESNNAMIRALGYLPEDD